MDVHVAQCGGKSMLGYGELKKYPLFEIKSTMLCSNPKKRALSQCLSSID
jgi:hypothetical protein